MFETKIENFGPKIPHMFYTGHIALVFHNVAHKMHCKKIENRFSKKMKFQKHLCVATSQIFSWIFSA